MKCKICSKTEDAEWRLNEDFLQSRLSQPQVWEVDFYEMVLALFLTFLAGSMVIMPLKYLLLPGVWDTQKKKKKKACYLSWKIQLWTPLLHPLGYNFQPCNPSVSGRYRDDALQPETPGGLCGKLWGATSLGYSLRTLHPIKLGVGDSVRV